MKSNTQRIEHLLSLPEEDLLQILKHADNLDDVIVDNYMLACRRTKGEMKSTLEIVVLGSQGCRFGMLTGQTGGLWMQVGRQCFLIDPGPSAVSILSSFKRIDNRFLLGNLDGILCSHLHPDHVGNLIPCIEGMTFGTKYRNGLVIGNRTVIEGFARLYPHHFSFVSSVILDAAAEEDSAKIENAEIFIRNHFQLKDVEIHPTPTRHLGSSGFLDTGTGFFLRTATGNIWYTSDTYLFDALFPYLKSLSKGEGLALVIANADASNILNDPQKSEKCHLLTRDVLTIAQELKPRYIIIHHYDEAYSNLDYKLAQAIYLNREMGRTRLPVKVVPSTNGLSLTVDEQGVTRAKLYFGGEDSSAISQYIKSMETAIVDEEERE